LVTGALRSDTESPDREVANGRADLVEPGGPSLREYELAQALYWAWEAGIAIFAWAAVTAAIDGLLAGLAYGASGP
jgi:hypothetical protein